MWHFTLRGVLAPMAVVRAVSVSTAWLSPLYPIESQVPLTHFHPTEPALPY